MKEYDGEEERQFHKDIGNAILWCSPGCLRIGPLATMGSLLDSEDEESWHWPRSQISKACTRWENTSQVERSIYGLVGVCIVSSAISLFSPCPLGTQRSTRRRIS